MSEIMMPGVYENISIEKYHYAQDYISASGLKLAKKSLALFKMYRDGELEHDTKLHLDFGNAFELALLDPDEFGRKVANEVDILNEIKEKAPDVKKPRATAVYKDWIEAEQKADKYIIRADGKQSFETIQFMLRSCYKDATIQKLINNIEYQFSIYWKDTQTGLNLKTRPDICKSKKNIIVDLKTTLDGSPEKFSRDLANFDYPLQACMQIDGVLQSGFMPKVDKYFWLVVEKEPPYSATIYEFDQEDIKYCMTEYEYVKGITARAIEQNLYPSYSQQADNPHGILTARIPLWYRGNNF